MPNRTHRFEIPTSTLPLADLERHARGWLLDSEIRLSPQTAAARRFLVNKLLWFLRVRAFRDCGTAELREFFAYLKTAHQDEAGRWGNAEHPNVRGATKPLKPRSAQTYFVNLKTLFRFLGEEGALEESPLERLKPPPARQDQIQPFTPAQVRALLDATKRTRQPRRNRALILFLLDTGCRASEVCGLRVQDVDLGGRRAVVTGKGEKSRTVPLGATTVKELYAYLKEEAREPADALFQSERGGPLTRWHLRKLLWRLGEAAGLEAVRCSPHTFRHTCAIWMLRGGANVYTVQQLLGHTSLAMTRRYLAIVDADVEAQHRRFSPADQLGKRK